MNAAYNGHLISPVILYFGIGLAFARIFIDKAKARNSLVKNWLRTSVMIISTIFFWPIIIFIESLIEHI